MPLAGLRYCTHAGDEIITTALHSITEIAQSHKGYDVPWLTVLAWSILSVPPDMYDYHMLTIGLPSYSTDVL